jgi:hypothetical protein
VAAPLPDVRFHDAEILALRLSREGPTLELDFEIAARLPETRPITVRFIGVDELEVGGVNEQNVVFDLTAELRADGRFDVVLDASYGLGGRFSCEGIEFRDRAS